MHSEVLRTKTRLLLFRFIQAVVAVLLVGGCATASEPGGGLLPAPSQTVMAEHSRQATVAACTDLVLDYALLRDQGDVDGYTALFSSTGSLTLRGKTITGSDAIRTRIGEARNGPMTRHLMSTIRIKPIDENRATGISYATIYLGPVPEGAGPAYVEGFAVIGNYVDEFVRTDDGWRIQNRVLEEAFLLKEK